MSGPRGSRLRAFIIVVLAYAVALAAGWLVYGALAGETSATGAFAAADAAGTLVVFAFDGGTIASNWPYEIPGGLEGSG